MKKINFIKKKGNRLPIEILAYLLSIGLGAIVGLALGGITWLCVGSLLGLGIGFLVEAGLRNNPSVSKKR